MARVTPSDVEKVFDTDLDTSPGGSLEQWIDIANHIVDDIQNKDSSISSARLAKIETLVAAHLAAAQDQRIQSTSAESKSVDYAGSTDAMDFRGTKHGQNAIALDPTGHLSTLGKPSATLSVPSVKQL